MPEPLTDEYLKEIQARVTAAPKGPWKVEPNEYGVPDQVGPVAFIQTWVDAELLPTVEFIGHARADLPALIGEVARLRADRAVRDREVLREAAAELERRAALIPDFRVSKDAVLHFLREHNPGRAGAR